MNIIDIARANGVIGDRHSLTALESRIRADERRKCAEELALMHLKQLGRATEHNYFAVASQSLRINSHLTDADGSQVQAQ